MKNCRKINFEKKQNLSEVVIMTRDENGRDFLHDILGSKPSFWDIKRNKTLPKHGDSNQTKFKIQDNDFKSP